MVEVPGPLENDYKITPGQLEAAMFDRAGDRILTVPSVGDPSVWDAENGELLATLDSRE